VKKIIYGTTEPASPDRVMARLNELGLNARNKKEAWCIFLAGHVLAVVSKDGKPTYAAGYKRMSAVGKSLQKLCRPS
jgi:hypothetical protein